MQDHSYGQAYADWQAELREASRRIHAGTSEGDGEGGAAPRRARWSWSGLPGWIELGHRWRRRHGRGAAVGA